jgi:enterochelin esterase-like enzyme
VLLSLWLLVALATLAGAPLAASAAFGIRRWRRKRRGLSVRRGWRLGAIRLGAAVATLVFTTAAIADALNRHYSYIPTFQALAGNVSPDLVHHVVIRKSVLPDHGIVEKVQVSGPVSRVEARDTYVYLPPEYFDAAQPDRRFAVLYLLHGSPGVSVDWLRGGYVDRAMDQLRVQHRIEPFIVVLPDFNGGYWRDTECENIKGGPQVQTYLTTDVVAYIDSHFRTQADRAHRAIGGLSTGGYCALNLGLRHQDVYSAIVSHSGYFKPDVNRYTRKLFGRDRASRLANTPAFYLWTIPLRSPLGVYLDVGAHDRGSRRENDDVAAVLRRRGALVTYNVVPGENHTWAAWRLNAFSSLQWVSGWFEATRDRAAVA